MTLLTGSEVLMCWADFFFFFFNVQFSIKSQVLVRFLCVLDVTLKLLSLQDFYLLLLKFLIK